MTTYRPSPVIHHAMLDVAYDLLASARTFADAGGDGALTKSRAYSLGVLLLVCSALEASINVLAGCHYDGGPGAGEAAEAAGWPDKWHKAGGHSLTAKWITYGPAIAGKEFTALKTEGAQGELLDMVTKRNQLTAHFKGRWAPAAVQTDFNNLSVSETEGWFKLTRRLIESMHTAYMLTHAAGFIHDQPWTPYPPPGRLHPEIPPIHTGSAGTQALAPMFIPPKPAEDPGQGEIED